MPPTVLTFKYAITRPVTNTETGVTTEEVVDDEYTDSLNVWVCTAYFFGSKSP